MTRFVILSACLVAGLAGQNAADGDVPAALLNPVFKSGDVKRLREGRPVVRVFPNNGPEVVLACGVRVNADGAALVAWGRTMDVYQRGRLVLTTGRFSDPPRLSDLDGLELTEEDLQSLSDCVPGDCDLKLATPEIDRLRSSATTGAARWRETANDTFRQIVLARAESYQASGLAGALPYEDKSTPVHPATAFADVVDPASLVTLNMPGFTRRLLQSPVLQSPDGPHPLLESYLFWSVEALGHKPAVAITHVLIMPGPPDHPAEVVVAAIRVFTSHYVNSQLAVTTISRGGVGHPRFLLYVNRSRVDVLSGGLKGFFRQAIEGQIRSEGPEVIDTLRRQLESGAPARAGR
jgi:hypothetical protein